MLPVVERRKVDGDDFAFVLFWAKPVQTFSSP